MQRIFITIADIQLLSGKSYSQAWRIYQTIKCALSKKKHQSITFQEFADYEGIKLDEILEKIKN